jgi:hypothetical protein
MVVKTVKEPLQPFRLFEPLSDPGKRRIKAIKRMPSSPNQISEV